MKAQTLPCVLRLTYIPCSLRCCQSVTSTVNPRRRATEEKLWRKNETWRGIKGELIRKEVLMPFKLNQTASPSVIQGRSHGGDHG